MKIGHAYLFSVVGLPLIVSIAAFAQSTGTTMNGSSVISGTDLGNNVGSPLAVYSAGKTTINIHNSCYGTNLRSIPYAGSAAVFPLAPSGIINASFTIQQAGQNLSFKFSYPALPVTNIPTQQATAETILPTYTDASGTSSSSIPGSGTGVYIGNLVSLSIPSQSLQVVPASTVTTSPSTAGGLVSYDFSVLPQGKQISPSQIPTIQSYSFYQSNVNCTGGVWDSAHPDWWTAACGTGGAGYTGNFMGNDGPLASVVNNYKVSAVQDPNTMEYFFTIDAYVSFPGQTDSCGSYYSPLMMFFSDARPTYENVTDFPINLYSRTHWPEAGAPGAFLAIDPDNSGKLTKKSNLFTDSLEYPNAFEMLKELDTNHDGYITAKDKQFAKLKMWFDRNGDGVSQVGELEPLSKRIIKISLKYRTAYRRFGKAAEERQVADFWYHDKHNKIKKGVIADVWFSPVAKSIDMKLAQINKAKATPMRLPSSLSH
jgi:hypothetical protein